MTPVLIREERDPTFWFHVASHPALAGAIMGLDPWQVANCAQADGLLPLASANGGFFFGRMDVYGFVRELHTLYRPEGWGREVTAAAKEAFEWVFERAHVVVTYEVEANKRSRPPLSFGFVLAESWFRETSVGALRAWVLTKAAWEASPAHKRFVTCQ